MIVRVVFENQEQNILLAEKYEIPYLPSAGHVIRIPKTFSDRLVELGEILPGFHFLSVCQITHDWHRSLEPTITVFLTCL